MLKTPLLIIALFSVFIFSEAAFAHFTAFELRQEVGEYMAELTSDTPTFYAGTPVQLSFDLWTKDALTNLEGKYARVWVKVARDDKRLFSGWLAKPEGILSGMNVNFPDIGNYVVTVRYMLKDGVGMPEAKFTLTVVAGKDNDISWPVLIGTFSAVFAFVAGYFLGRKYIHHRRYN